jgi:hypothetical protein
LKLWAEDRLAMLIVDEAQVLSPAAMEELRLLSNLEQAGRKLLQICLVGQPELALRLRKPKQRPLRQRITVRYELGPLGAEETASYVAHRLRAAGRRRQPESVFSPEAITRLHSLSGGNPREVNVVAAQAMLNAFLEGSLEVKEHHVGAAPSAFGYEGLRNAASLPSPSEEPTTPEESPAPVPFSSDHEPVPGEYPEGHAPAVSSEPAGRSLTRYAAFGLVAGTLLLGTTWIVTWDDKPSPEGEASPLAHEPSPREVQGRPADAPLPPPAAAAARSRVVVQVGSVRTRDQADRMLAAASARTGHRGVVLPSRGSAAWYVVLLGSFDSEEQAQAAARPLVEEKIVGDVLIKPIPPGLESRLEGPAEESGRAR